MQWLQKRFNGNIKEFAVWSGEIEFLLEAKQRWKVDSLKRTIQPISCFEFRRKDFRNAAKRDDPDGLFVSVSLLLSSDKAFEMIFYFAILSLELKEITSCFGLVTDGHNRRVSLRLHSSFSDIKLMTVNDGR